MMNYNLSATIVGNCGGAATGMTVGDETTCASATIVGYSLFSLLFTYTPSTATGCTETTRRDDEM